MQSVEIELRAFIEHSLNLRGSFRELNAIIVESGCNCWRGLGRKTREKIERVNTTVCYSTSCPDFSFALRLPRCPNSSRFLKSELRSYLPTPILHPFNLISAYLQGRCS